MSIIKRIFAKPNKNYKHSNDIHFDNVLNTANWALDLHDSIEDKIIALDYLMKALKIDLAASIQAKIVYKDINNHEDDIIRFLLPFHYYDENGNIIKTSSACSESPNVIIDLSRDCIFSQPWEMSRFYKSGINIHKNIFQHDSNNHRAIYYYNMGFCFVQNGMHSIAAGIYHKKGKILAKSFDDARLFDHVKTDGKDWICSHTDKPLNELPDFRIGALFEIAKMKHNLIKLNRS